MDEVSWSTVSDEGLSEALIRVSGVYAVDRPKLSALLLEAGRRLK